MQKRHSCELCPCGIAIQQISKQKRRTFRSISGAVRISVMVGAAGFEPTASSSRTRRATNCAMPRKYRSRLGCGLVGDERIELPQVESESTALPLCKSPLFCLSAALCAADREYYTRKGLACQPFFYFFRKTFPHLLCPQKQSVGSCKFFALLLTRCSIRNNLIL